MPASTERLYASDVLGEALRRGGFRHEACLSRFGIQPMVWCGPTYVVWQRLASGHFHKSG
jgi:hypothetical protein